MCAKRRKRPASEDEDDDADETVNAQGEHAVNLASLRGTTIKPSELLGPLTPSMEPIVVFAGPPKSKQPTLLAAMVPGQKHAKGSKVATTAPAAADDRFMCTRGVLRCRALVGRSFEGRVRDVAHRGAHEARIRYPKQPCPRASSPARRACRVACP